MEESFMKDLLLLKKGPVEGEIKISCIPIFILLCSDGMSQLNRRRQSGLVLDICEVSINQRRSLVEGIPIALNPVDDRRKSTQTWMFTPGLQLICRHRGLAVQVKKLGVGSVPVLACTSGDMATAPEHMCISHKLIPGSGVLSLKIIRDGPTRVLKVVDIR